MQPLRVGVIGCGNICRQYFTNARNYPQLQIVACADLDPARAQAAAQEHAVPKAHPSVAALLADPEVDLALNLTIPAVHAEVSLAALRAGKHVWTEKPLAVTRDSGRQVVAEALQRKLRLGGAPDTFLGSAQQTARQALDRGLIGKPVAATAYMMGPGHERWHPNPSFFYQPGGGPMFDMGPYYLTALINLFGPIRRLTSFASITRPQRLISSEPFKGQTIDVKTPDHITGALEFDNGVIVTIITSFATWHATYEAKHPITVYGEEGSMKVADPNVFDSTTLVRGKADAEWRELPIEHAAGCGRSIGMADLAQGLRHNRPHRGNAELILGVLDAMQGFLDSSASGSAYTLQHRAQRPAALSTGMPLGELD